MWFRRPRNRTAQLDAGGWSNRLAGRRAGFTVIEVLVCVGVVALLLSLALPSLAKARANSRRSASASNVHQIGTVFSMYAQNSQDRYPAVVEGQLYRISEVQWISFPYWQVVTTWPGIVYDYLPRDDTPKVFLSPGSRRGPGLAETWPSSYAYSTSFVGSPRLWMPGAQPMPGYRVAQRMSSVVFPSNKALIWDEELGWMNVPPSRTGDDLAESTLVGFADGSVRNGIPASASSPVVNPFPHPDDHQRLHNTAQGVSGRDF